jgi:hypothetical protein
LEPVLWQSMLLLLNLLCTALLRVLLRVLQMTTKD